MNRIKTEQEVYRRVTESRITGRLDLVNMGLTVLPPLPENLEKLYCDQNLLTNLPVLPQTLAHLSCHKNRLTELPTLPNSLTRLYCGANLISKMPDLPPNLEILHCICNPITVLPELPNNLKNLYCQFCMLTDMPILPPTLAFLDCFPNTFNPLLTGHMSKKTTTDAALIENIRAYHSTLGRAKAAFIDTVAFQKTLFQDETSLNTDCLNVIGSFLSGYSGVLEKQICQLESIIVT